MTFVAEDLKTLLNTYTYSFFTITGNTTGINKWGTITGNTSGATAIVVEVNTLSLMVYILAGTWTTELIVGTGATISVIDNSVPSIRLISDDNPSSHSADGEIVIRRELRVGNQNGQNRRTEDYRITVDLMYDAQSDPVFLNRLVRQFQYSFDAENRLAIINRILSSADYYWSMTYDWAGLTRLGQVILFVDTSKRWIPI